jgi:hypothetical protein
MSAPFPPLGSTEWYVWAAAVQDAVSRVEGIVIHDGTAGGGVRPAGYLRVRWVGGSLRPTNMAVGDIWEHDV